MQGGVERINRIVHSLMWGAQDSVDNSMVEIDAAYVANQALNGLKMRAGSEGDEGKLCALALMSACAGGQRRLFVSCSTNGHTQTKLRPRKDTLFVPLVAKRKWLYWVIHDPGAFKELQ